MFELTIIGGGLAGCEAAWQAAERGVNVALYEMRPLRKTEAHVTDRLAELVCSNSMGSNQPLSASGLLKEELRHLGSLLMACADQAALPAGGALAVDREQFASLVTEKISMHPHIQVRREEVAIIPDTSTVIASGPLTSNRLAQSIRALSGEMNLFFYDALAPIVTGETIDMGIAYRGSRYGSEEEGVGDYINCPMNQEEYTAFVNALVTAERIDLHPFEEAVKDGVRAGISKFFEQCLPIEVLAERGLQSLAFGPMRPVGLRHGRPGRPPYAVLQLRQDNLAGTLYNLVGCQTNLTYAEQQRVFRMIPGLEQAEFVRYGQMHRNTYLLAPRLLKSTLQWCERDDLFLAGQITGVEGYVGNIATGFLAGLNAARLINGEPPIVLPQSTMIGALCHYITHAAPDEFQPMKANFGLLPPSTLQTRDKRLRKQQMVDRALNDLDQVTY